MKQPDFQKLFFDHFGSVPRKVTYRVRQNSNCHHDLVFLSSLIHDARFRMEDVVRRGSRLTIPVDRDCWELGITENELHTADSRLTVSPVVSVEWRFPHRPEVQSSELWITDLWLDQAGGGETRDLVVKGYDWRCVVTLRDEDIRIGLADAEVPHLHSETKLRKQPRVSNRTASRHPTVAQSGERPR